MSTELYEVGTEIEVGAETPLAVDGIVVLDSVVDMALDLIDPDPDQARDEGADDSIGDTLAPETLLPPIEVRPNPDRARVAAGVLYQIIDGERRWRGSRKAGRTTIRATINLQHLDAGDRLLRQTRLNAGKHLSPMEEARTWKRILDAKGWSQLELASALGKPKSTVGDRLAILEAPAAFAPLFLDGTLSAAAAPILRQYAEVPEKILERAAKEVVDDWQWQGAIEQGKPVPLQHVKGALDQIILTEDLRELYDAELRDRYTSAGLDTVTIRGKRYATDVDAYDKMEQRVLAAREKSREQREASAPKKREPSPYAADQRKRMKAAKKKAADRRAQFTAVVAKLPAAIDKKWGKFLIAGIMKELQQDTQRVICSALGLEVVKPKHSHYLRFINAMAAHAETLDAEGLVKLALQLVIAGDLQVGPYSTGGADRLKAAAELARVDLSKIKAPDPEKEKKTAAAAKKPHRVAVAEFMKPFQPDAALAAIVGDQPIVRTDVTMKIWKYIKKHGLQDAKERRIINADEKLKPVFGGKSKLSMFEMTKAINKHLSPVKSG